MPTVIPLTPADPEQRLAITLDSAPYVLRVRWNTRDSAWYLDAYERDGTTVIALGVKLVYGIKLGAIIDHPLFNPGMFLFDTTGGQADPGFADLGRRVLLIHMTVDDAVLLEQPSP